MQDILFRQETDPGGKKWVIKDPPPTDKVIELHKGLHKAESALFVQARTKKIGLAEFFIAVRFLELIQQSAGVEQATRHHDKWPCSAQKKQAIGRSLRTI